MAIPQIEVLPGGILDKAQQLQATAAEAAAAATDPSALLNKAVDAAVPDEAKAVAAAVADPTELLKKAKRGGGGRTRRSKKRGSLRR